MKKYNPIGNALLFLLSILLLITYGCAPPDDGKIPITTSSKESLKLYLQGRELSEKLQGQESIKFFEQAVAADTNFALGYLNLSFVQPSVKGFFKNFYKAKSLMDKISDGERLWIKGVEAGINGFPMKQRELYKNMVEAYPQDERAHNILANSYFGQQEYEAAIEEFKRATEIAPEFSQPYNQLGYAYRFMGNFEEAEKAFKKYIELIPNDPNPYDSYAELLMKMSKFDESIEYYQKALVQNPNFVASFIGIATNLNHKGKHAEAREKLQELCGMARNDGERRASLFAKAVSFIDEGNLDKALELEEKQYSLAEKINDVNAMSGDLVVMGNILLETGKFNEALAKFEKSVELIVASSFADELKANTKRTHLYNAARIALKKKDLITAKAKSDEYHKQVEAINNPLQIRLSHELAGIIALEEKEYDKALEELKQASQQNPYNLYRIALAFKGKGDKEKAKKYCKQAAEYNALNNLNYAFIRNKARQLLDSQ
ncbi:MAG: tetratricopeptide repeat protein [Candidatus Hatepunaea meridiana]|nr:tetratricopeptide repeat protein [Candidatus Hatepunaea meridiana]